MKKHSISFRILANNFMMILIPIFLILLVGALLLSSFTLISDNSSALSYALMTRTSVYGPTLVIKNLRDDLEQCTSAEDFEQRFEPLSEIGFLCHIYQDGNVYFVSSNSSVEHNLKIMENIGYIPTSKQPFQLWNEKGFAYHSVLVKDNHEYSLYVCSDDVRWSIAGDMDWMAIKNMIKTIIIVLCSLLTLILAGAGIFLSRQLSLSFIRPLKKLHASTKEIAAGNFNTPCICEAEGELGELSDSFEQMRLQLLEHAQMQARYETNRQELLSRIAHDLNTPLTVISGYINSLLDGIYEDKAKQQEALRVILSQSDKMHQLIQDLFLYSTLSLDKEVYEDVSFNLVEFLEEWMLDKKFYFQTHLIEASFSSELEMAMVHMDPKQIMRILDNLLSNSDKYRKEEYVIVKLTLKQGQNHLLLTFEDDGIGIDAKDADELFTSFYRADSARSSTIKGHGLGLSIVKELIRHYNGDIKAEPVEPHGLKVIWTINQEEEE